MFKYDNFEDFKQIFNFAKVDLNYNFTPISDGIKRSISNEIQSNSDFGSVSRLFRFFSN